MKSNETAGSTFVIDNMDTEPPIATVHQAILALYRGSDVTGAKEKASIWLGEFQKSVSDLVWM